MITVLDFEETALALHVLHFYMNAKGHEISGNTRRLELKLAETINGGADKRTLFIRFTRDFLARKESSKSAEMLTRALGGDTSWLPKNHAECYARVKLPITAGLDAALSSDLNVIDWDDRDFLNRYKERS